jgi:hypothetical protein
MFFFEKQGNRRASYIVSIVCLLAGVLLAIGLLTALYQGWIT